MEITNYSITIPHFIRDAVSLTGSFDRLRWFRSESGKGGHYTEISAEVAQPAVVRGKSGGFAVSGQTLRLRFNGNTVHEITFSGTDPLTVDQVVDQLNGVIAATGLASNQGGELQIQTIATGTGASIQVLPSGAAVYTGLGLQVTTGRAEDTALSPATRYYTFTDQNSDKKYWYRARPYNTNTMAQGDVSAPIPADHTIILPPDQMSVGYVQLVTPEGRPDGGRVVHVLNAPTPNRSPGATYVVSRNHAHFEVDATGYGEIYLVRGTVLDLTISGTGIVRRITVPDEEGFDMLSPDVAQHDEFSIQHVDLPFATRTTL